MLTTGLVQKTAIKTAVSVQTSQKLVQTMLDASFGCIAYLRGLLPDDDFVEERYNAPEQAATASKAKNKAQNKKEHARSGQRIMRLRRNSSSEANKLLDYLVCSSLIHTQPEMQPELMQ